MAAGNFTLYSAACLEMGQAAFSFGTDNFNVILLTTAYTPNVNSDVTYGGINGSEVVAGNGYATGGITLTGITWTQNGATSTFAAQSAQWTGASFSARYAAIVRRASASLAAADKLLGYVDLTGGGNATATSSIFQINWNNASTPSSANTVFTSVHNP
jgi:hypothetical protein